MAREVTQRQLQSRTQAYLGCRIELSTEGFYAAIGIAKGLLDGSVEPGVFNRRVLNTMPPLLAILSLGSQSRTIDADMVYGLETSDLRDVLEAALKSGNHGIARAELRMRRANGERNGCESKAFMEYNPAAVMDTVERMQERLIRVRDPRDYGGEEYL